MKLWVRVRTEEQLMAAFDYRDADLMVTRFIIDYACAKEPVINKIQKIKSENSEIKFYYQMPDVLREKSCLKQIPQIFDGAVIKNLDELGFVLQTDYDKEIIADAFLYAMNTEAINFYRQLVPDIKFISNDELTNNELNALIENAGAGHATLIKAYGHQPVMITAQCMNKNYGQCSREGKQINTGMFMKDEFNDGYIALSNCDECYSIIYKEIPMCIIRKVWEKYDNILLDFTVENGQEVKSILENKGVDNYDMGHFKLTI